MIVSENALEFFLPFHYNVDIKKKGGEHVFYRYFYQ